jgi:2-polyprenyl-3-methyl-5-hydroxy-6-metoxy-1,4-benzoquinol methylase
MKKLKISCADINEILLESYISHELTKTKEGLVREHLSSCNSCWNKWNIFRWNKAKGTQGYYELKEYLGNDFQEYFDSSWALANEWTRRNPKTKEEIENFYREVPFYLYNLLIWQECGQRPDYVFQSLPFLKTYNCRVICDFGCGIGNDGLLLIEKGYEVVFCDFDNPSTRFLRWRLKKRGLSAQFIEPSEVKFAKQFDTLWTMDVLEHLLDPYQTLHHFLEIAQVCFHDTEHEGKSQGRHPFHIHHSKRYLTQLFKKYGFTRDRSISELDLWFKK